MVFSLVGNHEKAQYPTESSLNHLASVWQGQQHMCIYENTDG